MIKMFFFWILKASHSVFGLDANDPSLYVQVRKRVYVYMCVHVCVCVWL